MATYKNGINGPIKGKIGNVVAVVWRGIAVLRTLAEQSAKEPTPAQKLQREVMSKASSFLKAMKEWIETGFQHFAEGQTSMNAAVSLTMKHAVIKTENGPELNYAAVLFSRGELSPSILRSSTVTDQELLLTWDNFNPSVLNSDQDLLTVILYSEALGKYLYFERCALRGDREVSLVIPDIFIAEHLHCWLQYSNPVGDLVSTSTYYFIKQ